MSAKAFGIFVLVLIACLLSPTFAAAVLGVLSFIFQVVAIGILAFGLISLLGTLLVGTVVVKSKDRTYQY